MLKAMEQGRGNARRVARECTARPGTRDHWPWRAGKLDGHGGAREPGPSGSGRVPRW